MKALSLWQPWASLWCSDAKVHETRHWSTPYRGWLLVHAAKRKVDDYTEDRLAEICDELFGQHWGIELPFGAVVGAVKVVDCIRTEIIEERYIADHKRGIVIPDDYHCGDFSQGRYAFVRRECIRFARPIPYRGMQSLFDVPDQLVQELWAA